MAQTENTGTVEQKAASRSRKPKEPEQQGTQPKEPEQQGLSFCQAMEYAAEGKKLRRHGWDKNISQSHHVTTRKGETLPMFGAGTNTYPYAPSIDDAMAKDWYEINEGANDA